MSLSKNKSQLGFTLIELLVVIAIIGVLTAMILPAVNAARETGRRAQCHSQLTRLLMATHNFEMANRHFPAGVENPAGPIQSVAEGQHHNWIAHLLPYLDHGAMHRNIDFDKSVYDTANRAVRLTPLRILNCPTLGQFSSCYSDYAASHNDSEAAIDVDQNGVFFLNSRVRQDDIKDGLAWTLFLGEKTPFVDDLGWMSGTRATLRNTGTPPNVRRPRVHLLGTKLDVTNEKSSATEASPKTSGGDPQTRNGNVQFFVSTDATPPASSAEEKPNDNSGSNVPSPPELPPLPDMQPSPEPQVADEKPPQLTPLFVGGFDSMHVGGANVAFGDGNIRILSRTISPQVLRQLGHRSDGSIATVD